MKRINYFAMSLLASAALAFTGCSSEDLVGGETNKNESGNFYMTLTIDASSASNGTRTALPDDENKTNLGTTLESTVTNGTFIVCNANGDKIYTKSITKSEWDNAQAPDNVTTGKKTLKIAVSNITAGQTYRIYFLANTTSENPFEQTYTAPDVTSEDYAVFAGTYAKNNEFAMFNQNDRTNNANQYTVTFSAANQDENNPATLTTPIKIERVVARIDKPTANVTTFSDAEGDTEAVKAEKAKIASIQFQSYALANLAKSTYLMQHWDAQFNTFRTPITTPVDANYFQTTAQFGNSKENTAGDWFNNNEKNYVFENTVANDTYATKMYFVFKATWAASAGATIPDFTDGTFYRYEGKLYNSLQDIIDEFADNGQSNPFGIGVTKDNLLAELGINTAGQLSGTEAQIKEFREKYQIEVFERGEMYYNTTIDDQYYNQPGHHILRNSIYQLNVKNVYQIGTDVPNGDPSDLKPFYYLNVQVNVNPWVLNTYDVDL